jgi:hypothetical protein
MEMTTQQPINITEIQLDGFEHPAWDEPIICRVEVDLPAWLAQLTGDRAWEVCGEDEAENCISFTLRQKETPFKVPNTEKLTNSKQAEVTLYHNGYAVVDVDGKSLFDGSLTTKTSECAHLSYFHTSGEEILLN